MKKKTATPQDETAKKVKPETAKTEGEQAENGGEGKKARKVINIVINVILIVAIVVAVIATYVSFVSTSGNGVPNIFGLRLLSIQTDSMYDTLLPGDLILSTGIKDPADLRPGDIITYWTLINGERVLNTHRIVNIYDGGGHLIFETKGDNNTTNDPVTVHEANLVGIYKMRIPGLGKVFDYLQTSTGFLIVVVVPVFLFFLYHLVQFFRVLFEYQNVKNRIKFETERGRTEDLIAAHEAEKAKQEADRAALEAEIREKLRAELLASMGQNPTAQEVTDKSADQSADTSADESADTSTDTSAEKAAETEASQDSEAPAADTPAPTEEGNEG